MSRLETSMTIAGTMLAFMAGHLVCCGILPLMLNASAHAMVGAAGFDLLLALLTIPATAYGVTLWERRRHATICASGKGQCSHRDRFRFTHHLVRNLIIGTLAFAAFHFLFEALQIHTIMPTH